MKQVLAQTYVGNVGEDEDLAARVARVKGSGGCLEVTIGRGDRTKGRILTHTTAGQAVGIVKDRSWQIRAGDVFETAQKKLVLVQLEAQQVMALRFEASAHNRATTLVQLGYLLGNQHWPTTVADEVVYVEMVADRVVMEKMVGEMAIALHITGLKISFESKSANHAVEFQTGHSHFQSHSHAH